MPIVYLLRHAETDNNSSNGTIDEPDADLNTKGEEQARQVTGHYDLVLCSPMRRARRTLQLSQITYKEMEIVEEAREMKCAKSDFKEDEDPEFVLETPEDFSKAVRILKRRIEEVASTGKKILVSTHSFTIAYLTSKNLDGKGGELIPNASIIEFRI